MQPPKVSVVIVTFNQAGYVEQALASVVGQRTDFDVEIIVADDASEDGTAEIVRRFAAADPRIRMILRPQNVGAMANVVGALRETRGTYLALCEGDDFWTDETKLQQQADLLDGRPELAMCFHPVRILDEESGDADALYPSATESREFILRRLVARNYIQTNSVMYRRLDYSELPVDVMPLDWYLHLFHARHGEIGFLDQVMATYRRHAGGIWAGTVGKRVIRTRKYGLAQLGFAEATLRLLGDVEVDLAPVSARILDVYGALEEADRADGSDLLAQGFARYPQCAKFALDSLQAELGPLRERAAAATELASELRAERARFETVRRKYRRTQRRLERAQRSVKRQQVATARHQRQHASLTRCFRTALRGRLRSVRRRRVTG